MVVIASLLTPAFIGCSDDAVVMDEPDPWDPDRDGISTAVEEDPANGIYGFNPTVPNSNPSIAHGTGGNGSLEGGINLPNEQTLPAGEHPTARSTHDVAYLAFNETPDTEDWGTLRSINVVEAIGRWFRTDDWCRYSSLIPTGPRAQVGDLSLQNGGDFSDHPSSHQNGLDIDVRYMQAWAEGPLDLADQAQLDNLYDPVATAELMECFYRTGLVEYIVYDTRTTLTNAAGSNFLHPDPRGRHSDHFHVHVKDPDGPYN